MSFDFSIVRELRKRANMTLADVSERTGISPSVISKLERNQTAAELETLFRISRVFDLNTTDLIALAESRTAQKARADEYNSGEFHFQRITYNNVRAFRAHAPKGAAVRRPEIHADNFEMCWVVSGKLMIQLPKERHVLNAGEALQFDGALDHTYEAMEDTEILIIHLKKGKRF
ncbi:MAG: helix-turn-helix domain-containing protein [Verrucomicrobia bacterium]|nr:helix-turn-helix domain-containing protein [Verrucomicrobiota bacterium]MCH8510560.1 XRE family transcriptional regulator [Kiritimatiellia bacterium]